LIFSNLEKTSIVTKSILIISLIINSYQYSLYLIAICRLLLDGMYDLEHLLSRSDITCEYVTVLQPTSVWDS